MRIEDGCILRSTADDQKNKAEQINNSVIGRTDAEPSILWSSDATSQFIGKDPDAWKEWRKEVKGMPEDKMLGWHHRLNGHEFKQAPGDGEGQGSLSLILCCLNHQGTPRILEWVAYIFSRGSSQPRNQIRVSCIYRQILYKLSYKGIPYIVVCVC